MKIYAAYILRNVGNKGEILAKELDLSDIGWPYRKNTTEIIDFAAKQLCAAENQAKCISAHEKDFVFHVFRNRTDLTAVVVADETYPSRSAFLVLKKAITTYQDPREADKLLKIRSNLEEAQQIMVQNLEAAIGRGEKLSTMVEKADDISKSSKLFAREADKMNSCCSII